MLVDLSTGKVEHQITSLEKARIRAEEERRVRREKQAEMIKQTTQPKAVTSLLIDLDVEGEIRPTNISVSEGDSLEVNSATVLD